MGPINSEESAMPLREDVVDFLKKNSGKAFCDACIAKELGSVRRKVGAVTVSLEYEKTHNFTRGPGECSRCKRQQESVITFS
jgi:hypothetical protein